MADNSTEIITKQINRVHPESGQTIVKEFEVIWKELSYSVKELFKPKKIILKNISGHFKCGQLLALMGPSGCGKSSFLGCLSGNKRKGVTGSITISTKQKIKFAFIAQEDYLENKLTVKESLMFSSQLKNAKHVNHKTIVDNLIKKLKIENCINTKPNQCSGGQRKRISIALELVSRPNVLLLDEPTTGLDSVTTWQLINTLIELTKQSEPMAIIATIHQPSARLFNLFTSIYVLSFDGRCIYQGLPQHMVTYLQDNGLNCPQFHNPSDFALEVSSKEHGIDKVMHLASVMKIENSTLVSHPSPIRYYHKYRTGSHIWLLTKRTFLMTIRDPFMLPIRLVGHIVCTALFIVFWGSSSGELSGCADNFYALKGGDFVKNYESVNSKVYENSGFVYFELLFVWFGSIFAVLLTFPKEMNIFIKEYRNGWYSCFSYFMSKVIVDLLFQLTIPILTSLPGYILTGQYWAQSWRLYYFMFIAFMIALSGSSQGLLIGAWLMKYPGPASFIGIISAFPMVLFSGFMIPINSMPAYFQWISWINFMRFGWQSSVISIYGYNRCESQVIQNRTSFIHLIPSDTLTELLTTDQIDVNGLLSVLNFFTGQDMSQTISKVLTNFDYNDSDYYMSLSMLIIIVLIYKVCTYLILLSKVNASD